MSGEPDEKVELSDAVVQLFRRRVARMADGDALTCDRIVMQNKHTGHEDDFVVCKEAGGERLVWRVRPAMRFTGVGAATELGLQPEMVTGDGRAKLLAAYDSCPNRTFPH